MNNYKIFFTGTILVFLMSTANYAAPWAIVEANGEKVITAEVGDEITFTIKSGDTGPCDQNNGGAKLDGVPVNWKDGHKWTATAGMHILSVHLRWNSKQSFIHQWTLIDVTSEIDPKNFRHPGLDVTAGELSQIQKNIKISGHPMQKAWNSYKGVSTSVNPQPLDTIHMKTNATEKKYWDNDGTKLYQLALCWAISGDRKYSEAAIKILNAWASVNNSLMETTADVYPYLHSTNRYDPWIQSAELLKYYEGPDGNGSGWKEEDVKKFDRYMRYVLVPMTLGWRGNFGDPYGCQNQPLNVVKARMMAGIFTNDKGIFYNGYNWFNKTTFSKSDYPSIFGKSEITIYEWSINSHKNAGEYMEINRDEGHMGMCVGTTQKIVDVLWHQKGYIPEYDMYGDIYNEESTPKFFQGQEWLCKAALGGGANTCTKGKVTISAGRVGAIAQIYNHYHFRLKDKYPLSDNYVNQAKKYSSGSHDLLLHAKLNDGWEEQVNIDNAGTVASPKLSFTIKVNNSSMLIINRQNSVTNASVKIYSLNGKLVKKVEMAKNIKTVSLRNLNHGVYMVRFNADGVSETKKFLLK